MSSRPPLLRPTYQSITKYLAWVSGALLDGRIDKDSANTCERLASAMVRTMRSQHQQRELAEMQETLAKINAAKAEVIAHTTEARRLGVVLDFKK